MWMEKERVFWGDGETERERKKGELKEWRERN